MNILNATTLKNINEFEPVYQGETSECGLACISMLLKSVGINTSLAELREKYGAPLLGISMSELSAIIEDHGVETHLVRFDAEMLEALPLPAIVHVGGNHFVFVMRAAGKLFQVFDPAMGEQFLHGGILGGFVTGYALILHEDTQPKKQPFLHAFRFADGLAMAGGLRLIFLMLIVGAMSFLTPLFVGYTIDHILGPGGINAYWKTGAAFLLAVTGVFAFERFCGRAMYRYCARTGSAAMDKGFGQLINNQLRFFFRRTPGEIVERFSSYAGASLERNQLKNTIICSVIVAIITIVVMAYLHLSLAILSVCGILVSGIITQSYLTQSSSLRVESEQVAAEQQQFLLETVQGITSWKSSSALQRCLYAFTGHRHNIVRTWRLRSDLALRQQTSYALLGNIELLIMLGIAISAIIAERLTFGEFYAFAFLRQIAFTSSSAFYSARVSLRSNSVVVARAEDLFDQVKDNPSPAKSPLIYSVVKIKGLKFHHDAKKTVLHDINLDIYQGHKIAILGISGCGKSTLMTLLSGLDIPHQGSLSIDGVTSEKWEILRNYCYLQTPADIIFSGSVIDNITMFSETFSKVQCLELINALGLQDRISQLPVGLQTRITDSTASLSTGERQRLFVARALYANRCITLFDEPTTNLDEESARRVFETITSAAGSAIVVTHDHKHLSLFDKVYYLRNGILCQMTDFQNEDVRAGNEKN